MTKQEAEFFKVIMDEMINEYECEKNDHDCNIISDHRDKYGKQTYAISIKDWKYLVKALMFNPEKLKELMENIEIDIYPDIYYKQDTLGNNLIIY